MPFKPKTSKKIQVNKKHIVTLDSKHSEMIEKFNYQEEEELPKLKEQLALIKKKMKSKEITLISCVSLEFLEFLEFHLHAAEISLLIPIQTTEWRYRTYTCRSVEARVWNG